MLEPQLHRILPNCKVWPTKHQQPTAIVSLEEQEIKASGPRHSLKTCAEVPMVKPELEIWKKTNCNNDELRAKQLCQLTNESDQIAGSDWNQSEDCLRQKQQQSLCKLKQLIVTCLM